MYALPEQTLAEAKLDVQTAIETGAPHLSLYHLTLEPNTLFAKYPPVLPDDDASAEMQDEITALMAAAHFQHYEVSAYAKEKHQARHNLNYWHFGDYLGIGAGAHSKLSFPHRIVREMRYKNPNAYMQAVAEGREVQESAEIARDDLAFEFMLNTLRLTQGFQVNQFAERTGLSLTTIEHSLQNAEKKGLIYRDHQQIRATELGMRFLNDLQQIFLMS